jgi:hypothetical protein
MAALPKPELIAFIDESGDFELAKIDQRYPICAQSALTSTVDEYLAKAVPNLMNLKYHFFGNEAIVMHGHKIRKRSASFDILKDDDTRESFMQAVGWAINELDGCLIVAAVDKPKHRAQYFHPEDPFFLSLQFLLERLYMHWASRLTGGRRLLCVFEKRGPKEDARTAKWFEEICEGKNYRNQKFPFTADFRSKDDNIIGHQYADLVAYAACRFVETGDEERRDWQAVKEKLRKVEGKFETHGLKIFP